MYRDKRRKKHPKGNNKKRKPQIKKQTFKPRTVPRANERKQKPFLKPQERKQVQLHSEESSDEPDQFTNFLSSFNVQVNSNARETDSEEDSDEEQAKPMETAGVDNELKTGSEMSVSEEEEERDEVVAVQWSDSDDSEMGDDEPVKKKVQESTADSDSEISVYEPGDDSDNQQPENGDNTVCAQQPNYGRRNGEQPTDDSDSEISVNVSVSDGDSDIDIPQQSSSDDVAGDDNDEEEYGDDGEVSEIGNKSDPFECHFQYDLDPGLVKSVIHDPPVVDTRKVHWPSTGQLQFSIPKLDENKKQGLMKTALVEENTYAPVGLVPNRIGAVDFSALHIKPQIRDNISIVNPCKTTLTSLQKELFSIINNYQDLFFPLRMLENGEEVRFVYCLHAINHILKARSQVVNHNLKCGKIGEAPDHYRDQGLVRPRVLIVVPFKDSALRIIKFITSLLYPKDKGNVIKKSRFIEEYTGNELTFPTQKPKPEDYEETFRGNCDDNFRIGLSITKKSVKLYANFYKADIIVASPLGLRLIIGAEGEEHRDFDFLASIELLIIDQCEIFMMQNWEHMLHVMDHLHLQPQESHDTDFSRVRFWAINGLARYYRQTLLFSSLVVPEMNALFNKRCQNYAGKARVVKHITIGSVSQVLVQFPQVFHKFSASEGKDAIANRLNFFCKKILPQYLDCMTSQVLVFIPSYYDFVRVRNYFKREDISFVQICEYTMDKKIARARDHFFHNEAHFLLYTERSHFFKRLRIKGIRHLIFYQLPTNPHFYSELCNFMKNVGSLGEQQDRGASPTITVLYSKCDGHQLAAVVGTEKATRMLQSERDVHMFVTE